MSEMMVCSPVVGRELRRGEDSGAPPLKRWGTRALPPRQWHTAAFVALLACAGSSRAESSTFAEDVDLSQIRLK